MQTFKVNSVLYAHTQYVKEMYNYHLNVLFEMFKI